MLIASLTLAIFDDITHLTVYQEVFLIWKILFFISAALADSLHILACPKPNVKHFLQNSHIFFSDYQQRTPVHHRWIFCLFSSGQRRTDLTQGIRRLNSNFPMDCQIPQTDHSAQLSVFHHRQPSDLVAAHQCRRCLGIHIRANRADSGGHDLPDLRCSR